jgi:ribosomal protein S10
MCIKHEEAATSHPKNTHELPTKRNFSMALKEMIIDSSQWEIFQMMTYITQYIMPPKQ